MLRHPSGRWHFGRFVVAYPAGNVDFAAACAGSFDLLVDRATFASITVDELLDRGALAPETIAAARDRYLAF